MPKKRPTLLSLAGFDPSGGAGLLADIKTFEQHKVLGMGVATALTFQNDSEFEGVKWVETTDIKKQTEILCRKFEFQFVKVGMLESLESLEAIISQLTSIARAQQAIYTGEKENADMQYPNSHLKIIWDPILKASAGFEVHKPFEKKKLYPILKHIYLLTPNTDEVKTLSGNNDEMEGAKELAKFCNVLVKGGHREDMKAKDYLLTTDGKIFPFSAKKITPAGKHGSGCVLSAAITANLANGLSLHRSCLKGKDYVTKFLDSNKTLLGYHVR